ncbi:hypothetical protein [Bdellovibrio sp. HCB2-146]|uniref:hypothetical protein n=1 Tax=Bdellovibrio sp. HCB2-146 TaxID=3394362 RepID=UPI0039BC4302
MKLRSVRPHNILSALMGRVSKVLTLAVVGLAVSTSHAASYEIVLDQAVVQEIGAQFASFKSINLQQYNQLKQSQNAQLLEAQRSLYQFLQSTMITTMPEPTKGAGDVKDWADMLDRRTQLFDNPVIVQTGFEILARELSKGIEGAQCSTVRNTIRFISTGVPSWGGKTPGLDYRNNLLLTAHMFSSYVDGQLPKILPCQDEILDFTKVQPELKFKKHENCWDCSPGKFIDLDTRVSLQVLAMPFLAVTPFMRMSIAGGDTGLFKSYVQSQFTHVFLTPPENKVAREQERRDYGHDAYLRVAKPYDSWFVTVDDKNQVIGNSKEVINLYSKMVAE